MKAIIFFLRDEKYEYTWNYPADSFLGYLPQIGDCVELGFTETGDPAYTNSLVTSSFKVFNRLIRPGEYWWIEVEGDTPGFIE